MKLNQIDQQTIPSTGDDHVIPFQIKGKVRKSGVRGRIVRLGPVLDTILGAHRYPQPVSDLLAEVIILSILLGSSLKFDGRFVVHIQSNGPISLLMADFTTPDAIRAYAKFDEDQLDALIKTSNIAFPSLVGKGTLAMTIEQGSNTRPYQRIIALEGSTLENIACRYFSQSEQIPTKIRLAAARLSNVDQTENHTENWRAGGLIVQFLPDMSEDVDVQDSAPDDDLEKSMIEDTEPDTWRLAQSLTATVHDDELTDPQTGIQRLLYQLFHECGVYVYPAMSVTSRCRCSRQKILAIIKNLSRTEQKSALLTSNTPGIIHSKCEFCNTCYEIGADEIGL